jgi:hypothetical protein
MTAPTSKPTGRRGRDTTGAKRQQQRYEQLKALVLAAGWQSRAELDTAFLNGVVAIPKKKTAATD